MSNILVNTQYGRPHFGGGFFRATLLPHIWKTDIFSSFTFLTFYNINSSKKWTLFKPNRHWSTKLTTTLKAAMLPGARSCGDWRKTKRQQQLRRPYATPRTILPKHNRFKRPKIARVPKACFSLEYISL